MIIIITILVSLAYNYAMLTYYRIGLLRVFLINNIPCGVNVLRIHYCKRSLWWKIGQNKAKNRLKKCAKSVPKMPKVCQNGLFRVQKWHKKWHKMAQNGTKWGIFCFLMNFTISIIMMMIMIFSEIVPKVCQKVTKCAKMRY